MNIKNTKRQSGGGGGKPYSAEQDIASFNYQTSTSLQRSWIPILTWPSLRRNQFKTQSQESDQSSKLKASFNLEPFNQYPWHTDSLHHILQTWRPHTYTLKITNKSLKQNPTRYITHKLRSKDLYFHFIRNLLIHNNRSLNRDIDIPKPSLRLQVLHLVQPPCS